MSHISTSKERFREGLCRGLVKHSVKDGKELVGSFSRQERALNSELNSLTAAERRVLNKLDEKIKELSNKHHGSLPDIRVDVDRISTANHTSPRKSRASTISGDQDFVCNESKTKKREAHPALGRQLSSPLVPLRGPNKSSSIPDSLNLTGKIEKSPRSTPKTDSSPRIRRKRSASLHDVTYAASFQELRDKRAQSSQRGRATSLLLPDQLSANHAGAKPMLSCRYKPLPPSPLAEKKRPVSTSRSCNCNKSRSCENLEQLCDTATESDPNSVEALRNCRYLRLP